MTRFFKDFAGRTSLGRRCLVASLFALVAFSTIASATPLTGTVPTNPGQISFPAPTSDPAGMLLAEIVTPYSFTTTAGLTSGTLVSAVFKNTSGTLDFYYQVNNCFQAAIAAFCPGSAASATAIARETDTNFVLGGYTTGPFVTNMMPTIYLGFRFDGGSLPGNCGPSHNLDCFVDGTVPPITGDWNGAQTVVGFSFQPPEDAKILPGTSSNVLVISTSATNFTAGNAAVIDGGTQTVASFQPASGVPEPASIALLGLGLLVIGGIGRKIKSRP